MFVGLIEGGCVGIRDQFREVWVGLGGGLVLFCWGYKFCFGGIDMFYVFFYQEVQMWYIVGDEVYREEMGDIQNGQEIVFVF